MTVYYGPSAQPTSEVPASLGPDRVRPRCFDLAPPQLGPPSGVHRIELSPPRPYPLPKARASAKASRRCPQTSQLRLISAATLYHRTKRKQTSPPVPKCETRSARPLEACVLGSGSALHTPTHAEGASFIPASHNGDFVPGWGAGLALCHPLPSFHALIPVSTLILGHSASAPSPTCSRVDDESGAK